MSPARKAHETPTRRRRPPATHEADDDKNGSSEESQDDSQDESQEADPPEGEDGEAVEDEPTDDEPTDDEPTDEEPTDDEPADDEPEDVEDEPEDEPAPAEDDSPDGGLDAQGAARRAIEHLRALSHHRPEGVVGIERDEDGWTVTVEVLEDARVPSTSDVLAEYEVRLDASGGLAGVTRRRRYVRGRTEQ